MMQTVKDDEFTHLSEVDQSNELTWICWVDLVCSSPRLPGVIICQMI